MDLELRHLRVVCAIAEAGSVTKAASVLGLAQPALTAQLQRIERTLGGPLFDRDRRGARPTPLGELVLARARVLLPAVKGLQDEAARLAGGGGTGNRYRIGSVNGPIVGGLVHRLTADDPKSQVSVHHSLMADELAEMVLTGRLDFTLIGACGDATPAPDYPLVWRTIAVDPVFVMLPESHPLAAAEEVELAALADVQWAAAPGNSCFEACFVAACARAGFSPRVMYETDVRGAIDMIESGDAVALCQATFRPVASLVTVPIAGTPLRWRQLLGWHPDGDMVEVADKLASHAAAAYRDAAERNGRYASWLRGHPRFGAQTMAAA